MQNFEKVSFEPLTFELVDKMSLCQIIFQFIHYSPTFLPTFYTHVLEQFFLSWIDIAFLTVYSIFWEYRLFSWFCFIYILCYKSYFITRLYNNGIITVIVDCFICKQAEDTAVKQRLLMMKTWREEKVTYSNLLLIIIFNFTLRIFWYFSLYVYNFVQRSLLETFLFCFIFLMFTLFTFF